MTVNKELYTHNSILYNIYYPLDEQNVIDSDSILEKLQETIDHWTRDYIWHEQGFILHKSDIILGAGKTKEFACLCGQTMFGASVDDEWFITFLLFKLSLNFQDIIITASDDDGEFLLIECAQVLPKWIQRASDDDMQHRVYIYQGKLYIVPKYIVPHISTIHQGLVSITSKTNTDSLAPESMQEALANKLSIYKDIENHHYHHAVCILPKHISRLLHIDPSWISLITKSLNDAITYMDMIPSQYNELATGLVRNSYDMGYNNYSKTLIKFTKLQFAQVYLMIYGADGPKDDKDMDYQLGLKLFLGYECLKQSYIHGEISNSQRHSYDVIKSCEQWIGNDSSDNICGDSLEWLYDMLQDVPNEQYTSNLEDITKRFEEFSSKESGYKGVTIQSDETSDSYSSDEEFEVLDAIKNDPDLLMKIIEKSKDFGLEYKDIILKLQSMKTQDTNDKSTGTWSTDEDYDEKMEEHFRTMDHEIDALLVQNSEKKRNRESLKNLKEQIFIVEENDDQFDS